MLQAVVARPDEFFAVCGDCDGDRLARLVLARLQKHLGLSKDGVRLEVVEDAQLPGAAGHYDRNRNPVIRIRRSLCKELLPLTSTLAHELMHDILLGGGYLSGEEADHEQLTDLATVVFGLGIFTANSAVRFESTHNGNWESWSIARFGYLPSRHIGYASALFANWRNEESPEWSRDLRPDAREVFQAAERYLKNTKDCLFQPRQCDPECAAWEIEKVLEVLSNGGSVFRYAALLRIIDANWPDPKLREPLLKCLRDRDSDIAEAATHAITVMLIRDREIVSELIRKVRHETGTLQIAAIEAVGLLQFNSEESLPHLVELVSGGDCGIASAALAAIGRFGDDAARYVPHVLKAHRWSLVNVSDMREAAAMNALRAILREDAELAILAFYKDQDAELLGIAKESIARHQSAESVD